VSRREGRQADVRELARVVHGTPSAVGYALVGRPDATEHSRVPIPRFPLPLVGRTAETALLRAALDRAASGAGGMLFLAGEGGIGKTRLAQAAAAEAAGRGWTVAEGRAYAVETGVPYAVFADALLPVLRRLDPAALTVLTRGAADELAHLFPALFPARAAEPATGAGAAEAKARLYWSVAQLLARVAARQPLLLVLDNLQWADGASLELLHFVARHAHDPGGAAGAGARLLVLATYNDADRDANPLLRTTEQSLVSLGAARVACVAPLAPEATLELVQRAFDTDAGAVRDFATLLHDWTRGNPFFIEETLKSLVESGRLHSHGGRWSGWDVDALDLPRSVRDAVLARVERLGPDERRVLDLAAVLGGRVSYQALRAVSAASEAELLGALDALRRARILAESDEPDADGYDFSHPLVRDTVYAELGRARARLLHGTVAEALEALYGDAALAHADELAFHYTRAATGPAPKALRYLAEAGIRAVAKHADRAAAGYLQAALDQLDAARGAGGAPDRLTPHGSPPTRSGPDEPVPNETDLVDALARARQRLGERDAAAALWHRARAAAAAATDLPRVAAVERRLGLLAYAGGQHDDALAHYAAGLAAATAAGADELATRLRLAQGNSLQALGRQDEARRAVREALGTAERLGDVSLLARVHRALLLLHAWTGPMDEARAHGARAVELADAAGERTVAWSAHWAMAILGGLTGDAAATAHHVAASERIADEIRSPVLRVWTAEVAMEYMAGVGEWRPALALAERTIPAARALGQRTLLPRLLVWTGLIHRGLGDLERARAYVEEAWALSGAADAGGGGRPVDVHAVVPAHTGMAGYLVTVGEHRRALRVGEAGLAIADRSGYLAWAVYRLLPFVIESALWIGDYARVARYSERLRRDSSALGHALGLAWADTTDALLAYLTGPAERAAPLLRDAAAALEAVPFVFDAARLRRMVAHALSDAGDRAGAARELRSAYDVFARLGAERELQGTREQLRTLGARPPARTPNAGAGALSEREAEVARLVVARKSNKEIGAALGISARTVSTHLSNIFGKVGVSSRGELADAVRGDVPPPAA
jgi:DNA-binding CsgD family transcriptional regulator/tetratricopeptide (TPR) repeat protein